MMDEKSDRVAVVVFVTVDGGADFLDRAHIAEMTVRRTLAGGETLRHLPIELDRVPYFKDRKPVDPMPPVTVHAVREVGIAARNGYLWTEVTGHAFPREEESE